MKSSNSTRALQIGGLLVLTMALSCLVIWKSSERHELKNSGARSFQKYFTLDWSGLSRAEKDIQSLGAGQHIQDSIVADPKDSSIVYFSAEAFDAKTQKNTIGIYRYDTKTYQFVRLFNNVYGAGDFSFIDKAFVPVFYVQGVDNGRLVISAEATDYSPGPCSDPLLNQEGNSTAVSTLISMSLENPYAGFTKYTLPADIKAGAEAKFAECQKTNGFFSQ